MCAVSRSCKPQDMKKLHELADTGQSVKLFYILKDVKKHPPPYTSLLLGGGMCGEGGVSSPGIWHDARHDRVA
jgi:hypothetical protein